jgi:hypothetical protein
MTLLWCLCVALLLTGLALRCHLRGTLEDAWLHFFGKRVRVSAQRPWAGRRGPVAPPSRRRYWPNARVQTRAGP